ncbi:NADP-dependent oxidoreductase domain-containing protein [Pisolithus sp. B1]|nr:NADP-dependent oxidoreductase domain-containing protein [Pisolithus sp. B1]
MSSSHFLKLNNGESIPAIGLGTWQSKPNEVARAVEVALKKGYRHIDCAWAYGNEKEVGEGLRASGVPRSEVFITSKLWGTYHRRVEDCLDETLARLGTDYLDLYLIHWPVPMNPNGNHPVFPTRPDGTRDRDESWDIRGHLEGHGRGKVKSIGISNFSEMMVEKILTTANVIPAVNQLELHLYNPQHKLVTYLKSKGILPEAYSPLGSTNSPLLHDEVAAEIAKRHELKTSDVLLGYLLRKDIVILSKSVNPARIEANLIGALEAYKRLTTEDMAVLDDVAANGKQKRFSMPPWGVDLGFENWG